MKVLLSIFECRKYWNDGVSIGFHVYGISIDIFYFAGHTMYDLSLLTPKKETMYHMRIVAMLLLYVSTSLYINKMCI